MRPFPLWLMKTNMPLCACTIQTLKCACTIQTLKCACTIQTLKCACTIQTLKCVCTIQILMCACATGVVSGQQHINISMCSCSLSHEHFLTSGTRMWHKCVHCPVNILSKQEHISDKDLFIVPLTFLLEANSLVYKQTRHTKSRENVHHFLLALARAKHQCFSCGCYLNMVLTHTQMSSSLWNRK